MFTLFVRIDFTEMVTAVGVVFLLPLEPELDTY